jgi:recombinational DNA repair ATPase RecF
MKIIALEAENLKRLVAVRIEPDGNMVEITGKNGQGKTSVLDAIWWALGGLANVQATPVRKGEERAVIRLDLGELKVIRTFIAKEDGKYTSSIKVETAEGARFSSPQQMLDKLMGELSFDPLAFTRMKPDEQAAALRSLVKDFDFAANDAAIDRAYQERTTKNRQIKEDESIVAALSRELPAELPEAVDITEATAAFQKAVDDNRAAEVAQRQIDAADRDLINIENLIKTVKDRLSELEQDQAKMVEHRRALIEPAATVDTDALFARIENAQANNDIARKAKDRDAALERTKSLAKEADALTDMIHAKRKAAAAAIAAADLPLSGLTIADGVVMMDGVPFDQASDAQQLSASVGIAMALNPRLRVIRVRDGSLLDEDAMKLLADMAKDNDYQVWVERVDSSGTVGFVLEDGHIKGQIYEPAQPDAEENTEGDQESPAKKPAKASITNDETEGAAARAVRLAREAKEKPSAGGSLFDQKQ